jgi:hypothetical protein
LEIQVYRVQWFPLPDCWEVRTADNLSETLDATGGIDELLLAGEERVAGVADFQTKLRFGGNRLEGIPTSADGGNRVHLWVDIFFHRLDLELTCPRIDPSLEYLLAMSRARKDTNSRHVCQN